ncbi:MAG TPA: hypothetical protein VH394_00475 [Thermoanaerobaculia bacterium]|jgi:hypothetical protein|nr:hypothetical protein [Thermoanaerobaculia bacterium]
MSRRSKIRISLVAASVLLVALAASASPMKTLVRTDSLVIPAGTMEKTVPIDVRGVRTELLTAAKSRQHDVTLELDAEAERPPQVFYEVYLSAPKGKRYNVGNIALFGAGIRSTAQGEFHPAHVQLFISDALALALCDASTSTLNITFVAKGAEGVPPAKPAAALTIQKLEIVVGPRQRE